MNSDKEIKSASPGSPVQVLNKVFIIAFILVIVIASFGCNCEEADDEYYVKYKIDAVHLLGTTIADITISSENKDLSFNIYEFTNWETTIGPVQKGFNATLEVNINGLALLYTYIYVSKNDSPFVLKASDGSESIDDPRSNIQLSYTIDY